VHIYISQKVNFSITQKLRFISRKKWTFQSRKKWTFQSCKNCTLYPAKSELFNLAKSELLISQKMFFSISQKLHSFIPQRVNFCNHSRKNCTPLSCKKWTFQSRNIIILQQAARHTWAAVKLSFSKVATLSDTTKFFVLWKNNWNISLQIGLENLRLNPPKSSLLKQAKTKGSKWLVIWSW